MEILLIHSWTRKLLFHVGKKFRFRHPEHNHIFNFYFIHFFFLFHPTYLLYRRYCIPHTKKQRWTVTSWHLRSAKIQNQSESRYEEKLNPWLSIESILKILIRLRRCTCCSQSSIGVRDNLYHLLDTAVLLYANTDAYQHACFCSLIRAIIILVDYDVKRPSGWN